MAVGAGAGGVHAHSAATVLILGLRNCSHEKASKMYDHDVSVTDVYMCLSVSGDSLAVFCRVSRVHHHQLACGIVRVSCGLD
jgi:hypothetical protein